MNPDHNSSDVTIPSHFGAFGSNFIVSQGPEAPTNRKNVIRLTVRFDTIISPEGGSWAIRTFLTDP